MSKVLKIVIILSFCIVLIAQSDIEDMPFQTKIKSFEKTNVYWSKIKGYDNILSKEIKENHLKEYRNKLMKIFGKSKSDWNYSDEELLSKLYYHKININRYKELEEMTGTNIELRCDTRYNYFLFSLMFSDVILIGEIIDKKKLPFETHWDFYEYIINTKTILYADKYYLDSVKYQVRIFYDSILEQRNYNPFEKFNTKNKPLCLFFLTKYNYEHYLAYTKTKSKPDPILKDYPNKINVFRLGGDCYQLNDSLLTIVNKFIQLNEHEGFFERSYK